MTIQILTGDCRDVLKTLDSASIDSVVCDPPYELGFMGKKWDSTGVATDPAVWAECLRVLKPGGHLLAFSGTRTQHRMVCAIEDAGFEIRDQAGWMYGSGFPKSMDVSKAIDKAAGAERDVIGKRQFADGTFARDGAVMGQHGRLGSAAGFPVVTAAATDEAKQWEGWGTALKPAWEPICVARKPLAKGETVASNVLAHGTGALNIDGCRVPTADDLNGGAYAESGGRKVSGSLNASGMNVAGKTVGVAFVPPAGRWPANLLHDGSPEVVALFPQSAGAMAPVTGNEPSASTSNIYGKFKRAASDRAGEASAERTYADEGGTNFAMKPGARRLDDGSAARFFWCPKTSASDRHDGLEHPGHQFQMGRLPNHAEKVNAGRKGNHHPTVKPTELMRYLCRLVTPPGGTVLDPFMGSGSTLKAAELEGFNAIGIELDPAYVEIARRRIGSDCPLFAEFAA